MPEPVRELGTVGAKVCRELGSSGCREHGRFGYREMSHSQPTPGHKPKSGFLLFQAKKVPQMMARTSIKNV